MPHTAYDDDELGLVPGWDEHLDPNLRKEIRKARITEREADELRSANDRLEAENLIYRSGIPAGTKADVVARTFEGDRKDATAVKAYYEELFGPVEGGDPQGAGTVGDPAAADQRIANATGAGSSTGTPGTVDLGEAIRGAKDANEVREILAKANAQAGLFQPGQLVPRNVEDQ